MPAGKKLIFRPYATAFSGQEKSNLFGNGLHSHQESTMRTRFEMLYRSSSTIPHRCHSVPQLRTISSVVSLRQSAVMEAILCGFCVVNWRSGGARSSDHTEHSTLR